LTAVSITQINAVSQLPAILASHRKMQIAV